LVGVYAVGCGGGGCFGKFVEFFGGGEYFNTFGKFFEGFKVERFGVEFVRSNFGSAIGVFWA